MLTWKIYFLLILAYLIEINNCNHNAMNSYINPFFPEDMYCPDCGQKIAIDWYILKCSHCQIKRDGFHLLNNYLPKEKFCIKCGNDDYVIEIKSKLDFFEIHYASFKKRPLPKECLNIPTLKSQTKVWIEPDNFIKDNIFRNTLLPVNLPV